MQKLTQNIQPSIDLHTRISKAKNTTFSPFRATFTFSRCKLLGSATIKNAKMETPPPIASFSSSERHSISPVNLNKKRKLHDESGLDMSSPKQRFRAGTNICGQGLVIRGGFSEEPIVGEMQNELDQPVESEMDSNTFVGAYDSSMSSDAKDYNENSMTLTIYQNQPSASLNSYSNEVLRTHLCSLESRDMKEVNNVEIADLEDTLKFDPGYMVMEDIHSGFGLGHAISELVSEADAETDSMILYSSDEPSHPFILSSGRRNLGEGTSLGARRSLTIDQEFEQYFSSLLL